jgi:hypothetical protein
MEYNTSRDKLNISEYGRNIQKMIEYTMSVEDREKRNQLAKTIIAVMGQLNPHLRDVTDFKHKLWDHLFIMSDFKLDVDSPFPILSPEVLNSKPERIKYPSNHILFRYYGRNIELIINKATELPEGPEREAAKESIANHLKKSYLKWNRDSVTDEVIAEHLSILSDGKLILSKDVVLSNAPQVYQNIKKKKFTKHSNSSAYNNNNSKQKKNI